ncbi:Enolase-phosphatase E1 [Labeo rohita]|uniref:Enolase-phosphatase E1 n=1 Tax=Labeo rohita TaxID=84645 RepID=A0ABQ8M3N6_LABRO|nr:Enolase-phosphatase E1 [Labeo rohita]
MRLQPYWSNRTCLHFHQGKFHSLMEIHCITTTLCETLKRWWEMKSSGYADCLHFLERYTRGQPRELVRSCQHMIPSQGYIRAKALLKEHFGNEVRIASAYMEKALSWKTIKSKDAKALQDYGLFLRSCCNERQVKIVMDPVSGNIQDVLPSGGRNLNTRSPRPKSRSSFATTVTATPKGKECNISAMIVRREVYVRYATSNIQVFFIFFHQRKKGTECDSTSVLKYIRNEMSRFKCFVANRVAEIRKASEITQWRYVNSSSNPADPDVQRYKGGFILEKPDMDLWPFISCSAKRGMANRSY